MCAIIGMYNQGSVVNNVIQVIDFWLKNVVLKSVTNKLNTLLS